MNRNAPSGIGDMRYLPGNPPKKENIFPVFDTDKLNDTLRDQIGVDLNSVDQDSTQETPFYRVPNPEKFRREMEFGLNKIDREMHEIMHNYGVELDVKNGNEGVFLSPNAEYDMFVGEKSQSDDAMQKVNELQIYGKDVQLKLEGASKDLKRSTLMLTAIDPHTREIHKIHFRRKEKDGMIEGMPTAEYNQLHSFSTKDIDKKTLETLKEHLYVEDGETAGGMKVVKFSGGNLGLTKNGVSLPMLDRGGSSFDIFGKGAKIKILDAQKRGATSEIKFQVSYDNGKVDVFQGGHVKFMSPKPGHDITHHGPAHM